MARIIADNIISPLGATTEDNYRAVLAGTTALRRYDGASFGVDEAFAAALFPRNDGATTGDDSAFERLAVRSVKASLASLQEDIDPTRTLFILSTTKGDIERVDGEAPTLGTTAERIARAVGIPTPPITVSNACISGLSALVTAARLVDGGACDAAIVCGIDVVSRFVLSGFQSLKAISASPCRPFDIERDGLNLGEAAATVIMKSEKQSTSHQGDNGHRTEAVVTTYWRIAQGAIRNDAHHLTLPSKTAEGLYRCLQTLSITADTSHAPSSSCHASEPSLPIFNLHGTATLFNDQMESVAMERASLCDAVATALKGYFGHTLGAAGVLETVIALRAADDAVVLATCGYGEHGVSGHVNLSAATRRLSEPCRSVVKTMSGFGGCNAAALFCRDRATIAPQTHRKDIVATHRVHIDRHGATVDGVDITTDIIIADRPHNAEETPQRGDLLTAIYRQKLHDYPRFYKMDGLCRLGFVASELLLRAEDAERFRDRDDRAVVLFNEYSSTDTDRRYRATIANDDGYFPRPSLFIYTLPNIVTGEIAIRNRYHGETQLYVLPRRDADTERMLLDATFADAVTRSAVAGWADYKNENDYAADLAIYEIKHQ